MDLKQVNKFIKQVNQIRCCATPGCKGTLCRIHVTILGLGGALSITYACNGCVSQWALFEYELGCATEIEYCHAGGFYHSWLHACDLLQGIEACAWN